MSHGPAGGPAGAVVVVHGGRSVSSEPTTAAQPSVLRMIPVARAIRRGVRGTGVVVYRPRLRLRGWNGPEASPVRDLTELLDRLAGSLARSQVVLVGHSMGARAALRAAGCPSRPAGRAEPGHATAPRAKWRPRSREQPPDSPG